MSARARLCEVQGLAVEVDEGGAVTIACPSVALAVAALQGLVEAGEKHVGHEMDDASADEFHVVCKAARDVLDSGHRTESAAHFALPSVADTPVEDALALREALSEAIEQVRDGHYPAGVGRHVETAVGAFRVGVLVEGPSRHVTLRVPGAFTSRLPLRHAQCLLSALYVAAEGEPEPAGTEVSQ